MSKMLRVKEDTYALLMEELGREQSRKQSKRLTVDALLKAKLKPTSKKGRWWDLIQKARFTGPKTDCVKEIDLIQ